MSSIPYRFSGHETFPFRYTWLPKAFAALEEDPLGLSDEEEAMISLGVGKNMVRAIRFWIQAAGIVARDEAGGLIPTEFGQRLLAKDGLDPFLEDARTLWLLHWQIAGHAQEPLFAWDYLFNRWQQPDFCRSAVVAAFEREASLLNRRLSRVTLEQHFDVFLHTYVPTRGRKGEVQEDNLDSPLVELNLIEPVGERRTGERGMTREQIYTFRRAEKPEISTELFIYCLEDFWQRRPTREDVLTLRDVALLPGSPGQLFKLPEQDVRDRLEGLDAATGGGLAYEDSIAQARVVRARDRRRLSLEEVFDPATAHV